VTVSWCQTADAFDSVTLVAYPTGTAPCVPPGLLAHVDTGHPQTDRRPLMDLRTKRIYDPPGPDDGRRVLVDGIWPRGVSRTDAALDEWAKDLAPTAELRRWFGHDPARFSEFRLRYRDELAAHTASLERLRDESVIGTLTILYGARDREHNNARVLEEILRELP